MKLTQKIYCIGLFLMAAVAVQAQSPDSSLTAFLNNPFPLEAGTGDRMQDPIGAYRQLVDMESFDKKDSMKDSAGFESNDTLYSVVFQEQKSRIMLYKPTDMNAYVLLSATIHNPDFHLKKNIEVGMTRDELLNALKAYKKHMDVGANYIKLKHKQDKRYMEFFMNTNNRLVKIRYKNTLNLSKK